MEPSTRGTKRRARDNAQTKMVLNVDLNSPPLEGTLLEGTSSSVQPPPSQASAAPENRNAQQQGSVEPSLQGSNASLIDVEAIEDEVLMLSSSRGFPQRRNRARRNQPIMVVIDEDLETRTSGDIEGPVTTLSLNTYSGPQISSVTNPVINIDLFPDTAEANPKGKTVVAPEPAKEPTFTCPVCMNPLVDASSTICGHIFCKSCIKASIQAQKKCPTCRKKLTMSNFHRVYLPSTD